MKLISFNVNGLRSAIGHGLIDFMKKENADIYSFQEVKVSEELGLMEIPGYYAYWSLPSSGKGYSGTLVVTKWEPTSFDTGSDSDGRLVILEYPEFCFICCYAPNCRNSYERYDTRIEWDTETSSKIIALSGKKPVIVMGDFNTSYSYLDAYSPEKSEVSGYIPEEFGMISRLSEEGFIDTYRFLHPDGRDYTWWSPRMGRRFQNMGRRLDYAFISAELKGFLISSDMLTDVYGSDHCPIRLILDIETPSGARNTEKPRRKRISKCVSEGMDLQMLDFDLSYIWKNADWNAAEEKLREMQGILSKIAYSRDREKISSLQRRITSSLDAKMLAVRHVCESTDLPGVDGVRWSTPKDKMTAAISLTSSGYMAQPSRLVVLKSRNGKTRRVNVATWYDKAIQALYAFALDPVAEAWGDRKSFAFRFARSSHDMNEYIKCAFSGSDAPDWAYVCDVRKCYESINRDWIMNNIPIESVILEEFLNAGYILFDELFPTEKGIGLGYSLSPIIANMVLDGLQERIFEKLYPDGVSDYANGNMMRYADDIVVSARSRYEAEKIGMIIKDFMWERGLEIAEEKSGPVNTREGFVFMSRFYRKIGDFLYAYPSDESVERFIDSLKETADGHAGTQRNLILKLNRKIDGWVTYHKYEEAGEAFMKIDAYLRVILLSLCERVHPKWTRERIIQRYWYQDENGSYVFTLPDRKDIRLRRLCDTVLSVHDKVRTNVNPYLDIEYIENREKTRETRTVTGGYRGVWNRQNGRCHYCGRPILKDQERTVIESSEMPDSKRGFSRLRYIHLSCMGNEPEIMDESVGGQLSFSPDENGRAWKFRPLFEFFASNDEPLIKLGFSDVEKIIGGKLGVRSNLRPFWQRTGFGEISYSYEANGYRASVIDTKERFVVFRRETRRKKPDIPDKILSPCLPGGAKHELETFCKYLIKKYAL